MKMKRTTFEKQLKAGTRIEHEEHPWTTLIIARKIAKDHLSEGKRYRYRRGG